MLKILQLIHVLLEYIPLGLYARFKHGGQD